MDNPTFDDVLDWLKAREGTSVYVEVGIKDPTLDDADLFPVAMHVTLGRWRLGEDTGHDGRGIVYLPFSEDGFNRFYIDPARVTNIILNHAGLKIRFHDAIHLAMSSGMD